MVLKHKLIGLTLLWLGLAACSDNTADNHPDPTNGYAVLATVGDVRDEFNSFGDRLKLVFIVGPS